MIAACAGRNRVQGFRISCKEEDIEGRTETRPPSPSRCAVVFDCDQAVCTYGRQLAQATAQNTHAPALRAPPPTLPCVSLSFSLFHTCASAEPCAGSVPEQISSSRMRDLSFPHSTMVLSVFMCEEKEDRSCHQGPGADYLTPSANTRRSSIATDDHARR